MNLIITPINKILRLSLTFLLVLFLFGGCAAVPYTPDITDTSGKQIPGSIASLEKVNLGGIDQWISIRGRSIANPILLFLHGGPGSPETPLVRHYDGKLENDFLVVCWDQRGAGKSYSPKIPKETMNVNQFIADTHDLVVILLRRFNRKKVFVVGHSWGTMLGTLTVQKFPELFYAYVGVGQVANPKANEELSYEYVLDIANKAGNLKDIRTLEGLNTPEAFGTIDPEGKWFDRIEKQRQLLLKYGGCLYGKKNYNSLINVLIASPEYSTRDAVNWIKGNIFSMKAMWPEVMQINLDEQVPRLEVPVYFLIGRHDYNTPFELAEKYFNQLQAPWKELIWFENSAHSPMYEEPEKFCEVMSQKIRPEAD